MKRIKFALVVFCSFLCNVAYAQSKVVVVPLAGEDAAPATAAFANQSNPNQVHLTNDDLVIVSVDMTFPSAGTVIVNASGGTLVFTEEFVAVACSINKNRSTVDFSNEWQTGQQFFGERDFSSQGSYSLPFAGTRGFEVNSGTDTFMLVCRIRSGENAIIRTAAITAMFFPN